MGPSWRAAPVMVRLRRGSRSLAWHFRGELSAGLASGWGIVGELRLYGKVTGDKELGSSEVFTSEGGPRPMNEY